MCQFHSVFYIYSYPIWKNFILNFSFSLIVKNPKNLHDILFSTFTFGYVRIE